MSCGRHKCDWMSCTLCRSGRQSLSTFERASRRSLESWPTQTTLHPPNEQEGPSTYTSIDDAFDTVLQYMSSTTQQCKRFQRSKLKHSNSCGDVSHFNRFHLGQKIKPITKHGNPLQKAEDIHVDVAPGTYTVSAGEWGSDRLHTHVVHIKEGEKVDLNFAM